MTRLNSVDLNYFDEICIWKPWVKGTGLGPNGKTGKRACLSNNLALGRCTSSMGNAVGMEYGQ